MILCIADVIDAGHVAALRDLYARGAFQDGGSTAGWHARLVKKNSQMTPSAQADAAREKLRQTIAGHAVFAAACHAARFGPMLFSRYESGMEYGAHVDDALMGRGQARMRSDISFTVFLSDPADYDGGELVIENTGAAQSYKLPAGSMICYPSTTLHRVAPVTRGERLVAVSWVQSHVRSPNHREILFDLDTARRTIFKASGKTREFDLIAKSYANLLRLWADP